VDDVRAQESPLVAFSAARAPEVLALKRFLLERFYQHPQVLSRTRKAEQMVADLYRTYRADPTRLPESVRARARGEGQPRAIADYVAGMTDRFAAAEHGRLLDPHESA
jgi:dGTPase